MMEVAYYSAGLIDLHYSLIRPILHHEFSQNLKDIHVIHIDNIKMCMLFLLDDLTHYFKSFFQFLRSRSALTGNLS